MIEFFKVILYQPLYNLLIYLYDIIPGGDFGLAIIIFTILIKAILFPLTLKQIKSQKALQDLQPKMEELKKKFKDQKDKLAQATMELYKQEKVNPLSSCLPVLIQLPFLIVVYQVFRHGLEIESLDMLYDFVRRPEAINAWFLGLVNLANPSIYLAVLTGAAQFLQSKMLVTKKQPKVPGAKDESMMAMMNKQMLYMMPLVTVFIGAKLPSGLVLYWFTTTVLTIGQQFWFLKKKKTGEQSEQAAS